MDNLDDVMNQLSDKERDYLDLMLNDVKLTHQELVDRYGEVETQEILRNITIRRLIAENKISKKKRKNSIEQMKIDRIIEAMPLAIDKIINIIQNGKEHNALSACQFLLRPQIAYLERQGVTVAEAELSEGNDGKYNFTMNVSRIDKSRS